MVGLRSARAERETRSLSRRGWDGVALANPLTVIKSDSIIPGVPSIAKIEYSNAAAQHLKQRVFLALEIFASVGLIDAVRGKFKLGGVSSQQRGLQGAVIAFERGLGRIGIVP